MWDTHGAEATAPRVAVVTSPTDALAALPAPMARALGLAWEAHQGGNVAVGAVITEPDGTIVCEGRNRVADTSAPAGHLVGTYLAHAEIDVLGQLEPGDHLDRTLWTTLQPCLLCTGAAVLSKIGHVVFLAPDQLWDGIERLPELNAQTARRWPRHSGPFPGPLAVFAQILPTAWFFDASPTGVAIAAAERAVPGGLDVLRALDLERWSALPLGDALDEIWDDLERLAATAS